MRSYPRNSPEAAARILALVMVSDGHVCRSELEMIQPLKVERELGLAPGAFGHVMQSLCEDLLLHAYGNGSMMCSVDEAALSALLAEIDDPRLQATVLRLITAAAKADGHLADTEAMVVAHARLCWRLEDEEAACCTP